MARLKDKGNGGSISSSDGRIREQPKEAVQRHPLHKFFILISFLTSMAAFFMGASQVLGIVMQQASWVQYALRGFVCFFCFLVILVEVELIGRDSIVTQFWIFRGFGYIFVGLLGMGENERIDSQDDNESMDGYETMTQIVEAIAWNMIGCGFLYSVMGVFCLQRVLKFLREDYQRRKKAAVSEASEIRIDEGLESAEEDVPSVQSKDDEEGQITQEVEECGSKDENENKNDDDWEAMSPTRGPTKDSRDFVESDKSASDNGEGQG